MPESSDVPLDPKVVIARVAERYGILLGPDDPVFASLYLYELALEEHLARMEESAGASAVEIMTMVRAELARARAGAASVGSPAASPALPGDLRGEIAKLRLLVQRAMLVALLCLGGSVVTFVGTALLWLAR